MILQDVINKITNDEPFAFSRWGDGEFFNINKVKGQNCDGNIYYEDLGEALKNILLVKKDYYLGVQTLIPFSVNESKKYNQEWVDADVFHKSSMNNTLNFFTECLKNKHIVYIGNKSFNKLNFINTHIETPYKNSWLVKETILEKIRNTFDKNHKIYLFSCGMLTNYFIDVLWKENNKNTYIDVGSVFDPYVGRKTRSYHKKLKINLS